MAEKPEITVQTIVATLLVNQHTILKLLHEMPISVPAKADLADRIEIVDELVEELLIIDKENGGG